MERLDAADLRALTSGLRDIATLRPFEEFPAAAVMLVRTLVPGVAHSYTDIDVQHARVSIVVDPPETAFVGADEVMVRYAHEHPLIARFAAQPSHPALAISDFLSPHEFHRLGLYGDLYRRIDTEDQLAVGLAGRPGASIGIVANRGPEGFSARDRLMFNVVGPHVAQAYRTARLMTGLLGTLEVDGWLAILVDVHGRVGRASERARALLLDYFGPTSSPAALPETVRTWVSAQRGRLLVDDDVPAPPEALVEQRVGRRLTIRFLFAPLSDGDGVLLLREQRDAPSTDDLIRLGLAPREAEVLVLVTRGKTNQEIGGCLGISARTVQKHLEHIYDKLGVTGRTEAAVRAVQGPGLTR
ncbi:MAG TPA: helix-turn-helix transcriptional regulator [Thermomicrobiaceae bacterium]|nr:helix-turn-helix transcriptional regulator [Thermomicrobiaceae bacterium]